MIVLFVTMDIALFVLGLCFALNFFASQDKILNYGVGLAVLFSMEILAYNLMGLVKKMHHWSWQFASYAFALPAIAFVGVWLTSRMVVEHHSLISGEVYYDSSPMSSYVVIITIVLAIITIIFKNKQTSQRFS